MSPVTKNQNASVKLTKTSAEMEKFDTFPAASHKWTYEYPKRKGWCLRHSPCGQITLASSLMETHFTAAGLYLDFLSWRVSPSISEAEMAAYSISLPPGG